MFYCLTTIFSWLLGAAKPSNSPSATFELYKDLLGEYRFRLKASNGEIILVSEGYTTKASAKKGIQSVKHHALIDVCYEHKTAKNGQAMFNLIAANYEVIGTSEMYTSTSSRDRGIASVKRNAPIAEVVDLTK